MRCVELIMPIINDPTETDPLATIVYKRLSDARRPMNKKKDRLHQAMRAFEPMKKKDKGRQTPAITINGRATANATSNREGQEDATSRNETAVETLPTGTIAVEPDAGRSSDETRTCGGTANRNFYRRIQGPVASMAQAAVLLGGKLFTDS